MPRVSSALPSAAGPRRAAHPVRGHRLSRDRVGSGAPPTLPHTAPGRGCDPRDRRRCLWFRRIGRARGGGTRGAGDGIGRRHDHGHVRGLGTGLGGDDHLVLRPDRTRHRDVRRGRCDERRGDHPRRGRTGRPRPRVLGDRPRWRIKDRPLRDRDRGSGRRCCFDDDIGRRRHHDHGRGRVDDHGSDRRWCAGVNGRGRSTDDPADGHDPSPHRDDASCDDNVDAAVSTASTCSVDDATAPRRSNSYQSRSRKGSFHPSPSPSKDWPEFQSSYWNLSRP